MTHQMQGHITELGNVDIFHFFNCAAKDAYPLIQHILNKQSQYYQKLLKISAYYENPSMTSEQQFKSGNFTYRNKEIHLKPSESSFIKQLSSLLNLNEIQTYAIWMEYQKKEINLPENHQLILIPILKYYFQERNYLWKIIYLLLQISMNTSHMYYPLCKECIHMLVEDGLLSNLIKQFRSHHHNLPLFMTPKVTPTSTSTTLPPTILTTSQYLWSIQIVTEINYSLDVFMMLTYHTSISFKNLSELYHLGQQMNYNIPSKLLSMINNHRPTSTSPSPFHSSIKKEDIIGCKWMMLLLQIFQLWRSYSHNDSLNTNYPNESSNPYSLFETFSSSYANDIHNTILASITNNNQYQHHHQQHMTSTTTINYNEIINLIWCLFLGISYRATTTTTTTTTNTEIKKWLSEISCERIIARARTGQGLIELHSLLTNSFSVPLLGYRDDISSNIMNIKIIASIIQEFINACLLEDLFTTRYTRVIVELLSHSLRAHPRLCQSFRKHWEHGQPTPSLDSSPLKSKSPSSSATSLVLFPNNSLTQLPIGQLFFQLFHHSCHQPYQYVGMLQSLCCSAIAAENILSLLVTKPVFVTNIEDINRLELSTQSSEYTSTSSQWIPVEEYLKEMSLDISDIINARVRYSTGREEISNGYGGSMSGGSHSHQYYYYPKGLEEWSLKLFQTSFQADGKIIPFNKDTYPNNNNNKVCIRWNYQSTWCAILLDTLLASTTSTWVHHSSTTGTEDNISLPLLTVSLDLLSSLFTHLPELSFVAFEHHWNELTLLIILRRLGCESILPYLLDLDITITLLIHSTDIAMSKLKTLSKLSQEQILTILQYTNELPPLFKLSFQELFCQIIHTILLQLLTTFSSGPGVSLTQSTLTLRAVTAAVKLVTVVSRSIWREFMMDVLVVTPSVVSLGTTSSTTLPMMLYDLISTASSSLLLDYNKDKNIILHCLQEGCCQLFSVIIPSLSKPHISPEIVLNAFEISITHSQSSNYNNIKISLQQFINGLRKLGLSQEDVTTENLSTLFYTLPLTLNSQCHLTELLLLKKDSLSSGLRGNERPQRMTKDSNITRKEIWKLLEPYLIVLENDSKYKSIATFTESIVTNFILKLFQHFDILSMFSSLTRTTTPFYSNRISSFQMNSVEYCLSILKVILVRVPLSNTCTSLIKVICNDSNIMKNILQIATVFGFICAKSFKSSKHQKKGVEDKWSQTKSLRSLVSLPLDKAVHPRSNAPTLAGVAAAPNVWSEALYSPSVFPLDFSEGSLSIEDKDLNLLIQVSGDALEVLDKLASFMLTSSPESIPFLLSLLMSPVNETGTSAGNLNNSSSTSSSSAGTVLTYFPLLAGWLSYPLDSRDVSDESTSIHPGLITSLLSKLVQCHNLHTLSMAQGRVSNMEPSSPRHHFPQLQLREASFIDMLGLNHMVPFVQNICNCLLYSSNSSSSSFTSEAPLDDNIISMKASILDLLLILTALQPVAMNILISIVTPSQGLASSQPTLATTGGSEKDSSLLLDAIEKLLFGNNSSHPVDTSPFSPSPVINHKIFDLLQIMTSQVQHSILCRSSLQLIKNKHFLIKLTEPLLFNLPSSPLPSNLDTSVLSNALLTTTYPAIESEVVYYSHQLLQHASILNFISTERIGSLPIGDVEVTSTIKTFMDTFFERVNQSHRFQVWMTSYMTVDIQIKLLTDVDAALKQFGISLASIEVRRDESVTVTLSTDKSTKTNTSYNNGIADMKFGTNYYYDTDILADYLENAITVNPIRDNNSNDISHVRKPRERITSKSDSNRINTIISQVKIINLMLSVYDAQFALLQSWRKFLEIFVYSPIIRTSGSRRSPSLSGGGGGSPSHSLLTSRTRSSSGSSIDLRGGAVSGGESSPSSPGNFTESTFTGDKRSYCLLKCVSKQLAEENRMGNIGAQIVLEKSEILLSMIHHQLKDVELRASDPRYAQVEHRDVRSSRMTPAKIVEVLYLLEKACERVSTEWGTSPPSEFTRMDEYHRLKLEAYQRWVDVLSRLVVSMLLLLTALDHNGRRSGDQSLNLLRVRLYRRTIMILTKEIQHHGVESFFSPVSRKGEIATTVISTVGEEQDETLSCHQTLIVSCLKVLWAVLPVESDLMSLAIREEWRGIAEDSDLTAMLVSLFRSVSSSESLRLELVTEHNYDTWTDFTPLFPRGSVKAKVPRAATGGVGISKAVCISAAEVLTSITDVLQRLIKSDYFPGTAVAVGLMNEITSNPLLLTLQSILRNQPVAKVAAYMGYSATTGEPSLFLDLWIRVVHIVACIIDATNKNSHCSDHNFPSTDDGDDNDDTTVVSTLRYKTSQFIDTYTPLLLLPFTIPTTRFTIQQLHIFKSHLHLLNRLNQRLPSWKLNLPTLSDKFKVQILAVVALFADLLGVDVTHQRHLHGHIIAVSKIEQLEESSLRNKRRFKRLFTKGTSSRIAQLRRRTSKSPTNSGVSSGSGSGDQQRLSINTEGRSGVTVDGSAPPLLGGSKIQRKSFQLDTDHDTDHGTTSSTSAFFGSALNPMNLKAKSTPQPQPHLENTNNLKIDANCFERLPGASFSSFRSDSTHSSDTYDRGGSGGESRQPQEETQGILVELLEVFHVIMIDTLSECLTYLWNDRPAPPPLIITTNEILESIDAVDIGSQVFFRNPMDATVAQGVITGRYKSNDTPGSSTAAVVGYAVLLPDATRIEYLPAANLLFTTLPLFPLAVSDVYQEEEEEADNAVGVMQITGKSPPTIAMPTSQGLPGKITTSERNRDRVLVPTTNASRVLSTPLLCTSLHLVKILQFCLSNSNNLSSTSSRLFSDLLNLDPRIEGGGIDSISPIHRLANWTALNYVYNCSFLHKLYPDREDLRDQIELVCSLLTKKFDPIDSKALLFTASEDWISTCQDIVSMLSKLKWKINTMKTEKELKSVTDSIIK